MIVHIEGRTIEIKEPLPSTLKKYGLSLNDWKELLAIQGYRCPICGNVLEKRINIDHFHVQNWRKMKPEKRKLYVRGLLCFFCNKYYVGKGINIQRARNVLTYLSDFEKRKPNEKTKNSPKEIT